MDCLLPLRLPASANASWDLIVIQGPDELVTCPSCLFIFHSTTAGRYHQLRQLVQSKEWQSVHLSRYQYIYLPEGDVYHATGQIDRLLHVLLAQMLYMHASYLLAAPSAFITFGPYNFIDVFMFDTLAAYLFGSCCLNSVCFLRHHVCP